MATQTYCDICEEDSDSLEIIEDSDTGATQLVCENCIDKTKTMKTKIEKKMYAVMLDGKELAIYESKQVALVTARALFDIQPESSITIQEWIMTEEIILQ